MINDSNDESEQHLLWCAYTNFRLIHTLVFNYLGTYYTSLTLNCVFQCMMLSASYLSLILAFDRV